MAQKYIQQKEYVDHLTGETITTEKTFTIKVRNSDEFFMIFVQFMSPMYKIKSITDMHLLAKMCGMMTFNSNQVLFTAKIRKEICDELGINSPNLSRSIARLRELGLLTGDKGTYIINPVIVWKGAATERTKFLRKQFNVIFQERDDQSLPHTGEDDTNNKEIS